MNLILYKVILVIVDIHSCIDTLQERINGQDINTFTILYSKSKDLTCLSFHYIREKQNVTIKPLVYIVV